jgi:hypothetical protein
MNLQRRNDMPTHDLLFVLLFITNFLLVLMVARLQKRLDKMDEWADSVDEFMDNDYIELDFEVDNGKNKKS